MPITVLGGTKLADTAFSIDNSCLFDAASGAYMSKSLGTPTNAKKATYSVWIKRCSLGTHSNSNDSSAGQGIVTFKPSNGNFDSWKFNNGDKLDFYSETSASQTYWVADGPENFRDVSAWYHIVIALDSTQSTAANRFKVYVNGTQLTNPTQTSYIDQNTDHVGLASGSTVYVGLTKAHNTNVAYADYYMAEVCFIDGTQYAASDFGEFDEDSPTIWKPKDPSGLTFGNNGFYLDFEDSSNLGNDANGGTDLTETNIAATDQSVDTPTNNACTLNSLAVATSSALAFSEGNNKIYHSGSGWRPAFGTFPVSSGKWYFEVKGLLFPGTSYMQIGWVSLEYTGNGNSALTDEISGWGNTDPAVVYDSRAGNIYYQFVTSNSNDTSYGDSYTAGDVIGVALDLDNSKIYFAEDNTWKNSGDPTSGATGTGAHSILSGYTWVPFIGLNNATAEATFASPVQANSSDAQDGNGYGQFEFAPPSGYLALCSKNTA